MPNETITAQELAKQFSQMTPVHRDGDLTLRRRPHATDSLGLSGEDPATVVDKFPQVFSNILTRYEEITQQYQNLLSEPNSQPQDREEALGTTLHCVTEAARTVTFLTTTYSSEFSPPTPPLGQLSDPKAPDSVNVDLARKCRDFVGNKLRDLAQLALEKNGRSSHLQEDLANLLSQPEGISILLELHQSTEGTPNITVEPYLAALLNSAILPPRENRVLKQLQKYVQDHQDNLNPRVKKFIASTLVGTKDIIFSQTHVDQLPKKDLNQLIQRLNTIDSTHKAVSETPIYRTGDAPNLISLFDKIDSTHKKNLQYVQDSLTGIVTSTMEKLVAKSSQEASSFHPEKIYMAVQVFENIVNRLMEPGNQESSPTATHTHKNICKQIAAFANIAILRILEALQKHRAEYAYPTEQGYPTDSYLQPLPTNMQMLIRSEDMLIHIATHLLNQHPHLLYESQEQWIRSQNRTPHPLPVL